MKILVRRTIPRIRSGLGDDVDDPAERPSVFGSKAVVDHAEFLHRFLGRRGALHPGIGVDEVGAVNRNFITERAHAAERNLRDFKLREGGAQARPARRHARRQQREVGEEPPADRQRLNLGGVDRLADAAERSPGDVPGQIEEITAVAAAGYALLVGAA